MGRRGLGRGLSALIATGESVGGLKFEELPTTAIRPNVRQPRRSFPEAGIKELAASIQEVGILQPLVVRSTENGFELIAGERRLRAAQEAGLDRVPVLIREANENQSMELALVENLQREDLNPLETAAAYQTLMEGFGLSKEQLANRLGKSRAAVTNTLRLAQLPEKVSRPPRRRQAYRGARAGRCSASSTEEQMVRPGAEDPGRKALRQEDRRAGPRVPLGSRPGRPAAAPATQRDAHRVRRGLEGHARGARTAGQGKAPAAPAARSRSGSARGRSWRRSWP